MSVRVTVSARGALARQIPGGATAVALPDAEASVGTLLDQLGVARSSCIAVVNGTAAGPATRLRDGDRVQLYPQQAGG